MRLQQLRKAKYSILASILQIFNFFFLTEPHTYLYNTWRKSHGFLISCFKFGNIFQKMWLFGKIHFVILFWTRSYLKINKLYTYLVFSNVACPTSKSLHRLNCCSFHRADEFIFVFCTLHCTIFPLWLPFHEQF